jgi:hypothetical protein
MMVHVKVEPGEVQRPTGLATVEFLHRHEVFKIFVVSPDFKLVMGIF